MENKKNDDIEIREHEIEHILGRTPGILLHIGITVIFVVFLVILVGSSFFSYPDMISAPIRLVTEHAPAPLVCKMGGKLMEIRVKDNITVNPGNILAVLENTANVQDMLNLYAVLEGKDSTGLTEIVFGNELRLGDVQAAYAAWKYTRIAYDNFRQLKYHERRIQAMKEQIGYMKEYIGYGNQQREYLDEELSILTHNYQQDQQLAQKKVISGEELDNVKTGLLQKKYNSAVNQASLADSKVRMSQLEQSIIDLELDYQKQKKELEDDIHHSREVLHAQVKAWDQNYVIRAPEFGQVAFTKFWTNGDYVAAGETLFTIVPDGKGNVIGRIELPMLKSGKVAKGQRVHVKLDNYPYMEYGILEGTVNHISPIPNIKFYNVEVVFPRKLVSSYGKDIPLLQGMSGMADIITEDQSLFKRLMFPFKALMKNNLKK